MMIGIEHLNRVRDPEKSSGFYQKILGMKRSESRRGPPSSAAAMHFGFRARTKAEFEGWKDWLAQNRVKITSAGEESGGGIRFSDPDGCLIEVNYEK